MIRELGNSVEKGYSIDEMPPETVGCLYIKYNESQCIPYVEINSNWITVLNVKPETTNPLEEDKGENLCDILKMVIRSKETFTNQSKNTHGK